MPGLWDSNMDKVPTFEGLAAHFGSQTGNETTGLARKVLAQHKGRRMWEASNPCCGGRAWGWAKKVPSRGWNWGPALKGKIESALWRQKGALLAERADAGELGSLTMAEQGGMLERGVQPLGMATAWRPYWAVWCKARCSGRHFKERSDVSRYAI